MHQELRARAEAHRQEAKAKEEARLKELQARREAIRLSAQVSDIVCLTALNLLQQCVPGNACCSRDALRSG
jgi:hypothetical protein